SALGLDLGVNAKIATADEDKALGTGANDYGVNIDMYRDFDGTLLFGGIGHTWLGSSDYIDVDSISTGNVGVSQRLGRARVGTLYEHRSASFSTLEPRRDLIGFVNLPSAGKGRLQLYVSHGLSDSSPDWGVGIALSSGHR
ncbi:MAG TPA: transporter, partial [Pseudoxanthomonas sp.]|nr:transporter [Pseudoxanthomonas sp.]